MTKLIGELLFAMASTLIKGWANSFVQKVGGWLDTKVHGRRQGYRAAARQASSSSYLLGVLSA
jgi:hypothetical protein